MNATSFDMLRNRLAKKIQSARRASGLSQEALALTAEVDRTYVSQLERGIANPSLRILHRLAEVLGVELKVTLGSSHAGKRSSPKECD